MGGEQEGKEEQIKLDEPEAQVEDGGNEDE